MSYMMSRWVSLDGRYAIEKKYHSRRAVAAMPKNKEKRAKKSQETTLTQAKVNKRIREERYMLLALDNFKLGDIYLTLTYANDDGEPGPAEKVREDFEKWKRRARAIYRKSGLEMKYMSVLENLVGNGRAHAHVLMPALPDKALRDVIAAWEKGRVRVEIYQGELRDAKKLMQYFVKEEIDKATGNGRLMASRNLVRREPVKVRVTRADTWYDGARVPRGYMPIKEFSRSDFTRDNFPIQINYFERLPGNDDAYAWGGREHERVFRGASADSGAHGDVHGGVRGRGGDGHRGGGARQEKNP